MAKSNQETKKQTHQENVIKKIPQNELLKSYGISEYQKHSNSHKRYLKHPFR